MAKFAPRQYFDPPQWARVHDPEVHAPGYGALRCVSHQAAALAAAHYSPGQRWLDIGCGPGRVVTHWTRQGRDILGIDHDPRMLTYARDGSAAPIACYVAASAYRLPCPDASMDGVLASLLTGCLAEPERFFAEARRVLRPNGRAVLTFTSGRAVSLRVMQFLRWLRVLPKIDPVTGGSFRRYRCVEVESLLHTSGLAAERPVFVNCVLPWGARFVPLVWRERLCRHFIVIARPS